MKKSFKIKFISFFAVCVFMIQPVNSFAASEDLLHETKKIETLTSGVTYEKSTRLYKGGWMDIYVIKADIKNPNVAFEVIESVGELGIKQSVEKMAKENNVVAAVNGDFFGSGNPMSSMGQVFKDDEFYQGQNYYNYEDSKYAGVFIDNENTPFIDYLLSRINFYNSDSVALDLQAKNKITKFAKPVYFDRSAITSTADIDKRYSSLVKIVVEGNVITKISSPGETVDVPENGYIIVMNKATADEKLQYYSVGQNVYFDEENRFIFRPEKNTSNIKAGISGGGEILRNGQVVANGLIIGQNGRNPRTAVGVDKDKTQVIIMAIDGRGKSIGATHTELGNLLLEYGAYDAIHLDGGGSTTVAVRNENERQVSVENVPSEGSQRLVANSVGIKSTSPQGELGALNVYIKNDEDNNILSQVGVEMEVWGFDVNHNPIDINPNDVVYSVSGVEGSFSGNIFTPESEGKATITAKLGEVTKDISVNVLSAPTSIKIYADKKTLGVGESTALSADLLNKDGFSSQAKAWQMQWSVDNSSIGYVDGGNFIATGDGLVNLTGSLGNASSTITLSVGKVASYITSFEEERALKMFYYPEESGISGGAGITNAQVHDGSRSLLLSYKFAPNSTVTQATYVGFEDQPLILSGYPTDIGLWAKGDGSGNLLKMLIKDSNNKDYTLSISDNMDFTDWQYFNVSVPSDVKYPIRIDKIYVAALQTGENASGTVYIDNISQLGPKDAPQDQQARFKDYLNKEITSAPSAGEEDITIFGQTKNKSGSNSEQVLSNTISKMQQNARAMIFAGPTEINNTSNVVAVRWNNKYETTGTENVSIVNLATSNGSIRTSDVDQWRWLQGFLESYSKNNIIINMDKNIWSSKYNLNDSRESQLLHSILKEFAEKTGKNVMVISATDYSTGINVKDGVRYINLNGLTTSNSEDLSSYTYLRVRADKDNMYYDFQKVY